MAAVAVLALAGCGQTAVDEDAALELVGRVVDAAVARDFEALCDLAASKQSCDHAVEVAGAVAPEVPPEVVCTWPHQSGRVVVLVGEDARGSRYVAELAVQGDGEGGLVAAIPIFWIGPGVELPGDGPVAGGEGLEPEEVRCPGPT